jgi:2-methylcitrate dehydratase
VVHGDAKPFPGHPRTPFSDADLEAKLRENVELPVENSGRLVETLLSVERLGSVRDLGALLGAACTMDIDGEAEE